MIGQDSFPAMLDYCKKIVHALKTRQSVDSSRAALYQDTRPGNIPLILNYDLAANESKLTEVTFTHPDSPTPYTQLMLEFTDGTSSTSINFTIYRDPVGLTDEYITRWVVQFRNLGAVPNNFNTHFRVKASSPGTLAVAIL